MLIAGQANHHLGLHLSLRKNILIVPKHEECLWKDQIVDHVHITTMYPQGRTRNDYMVTLPFLKQKYLKGRENERENMREILLLLVYSPKSHSSCGCVRLKPGWKCDSTRMVRIQEPPHVASQGARQPAAGVRNRTGLNPRTPCRCLKQCLLCFSRHLPLLSLLQFQFKSDRTSILQQPIQLLGYLLLSFMVERMCKC